MRAITKSTKRHPAAKKCCGWEEPAICDFVCGCVCRGQPIFSLENDHCQILAPLN